MKNPISQNAPVIWLASLALLGGCGSQSTTSDAPLAPATQSASGNMPISLPDGQIITADDITQAISNSSGTQQQALRFAQNIAYAIDGNSKHPSPCLDGSPARITQNDAAPASVVIKQDGSHYTVQTRFTCAAEDKSEDKAADKIDDIVNISATFCDANSPASVNTACNGFAFALNTNVVRKQEDAATAPNQTNPNHEAATLSLARKNGQNHNRMHIITRWPQECSNDRPAPNLPARYTMAVSRTALMSSIALRVQLGRLHDAPQIHCTAEENNLTPVRMMWTLPQASPGNLLAANPKF